jgi:molybdopterin-guanine dinucleotide biosynthesis protein A
VVGVVLAGGASRRMGRDKATLQSGAAAGQTLAVLAAERLRAACGHVVLADAGRGLVSGLPSLPDGPGGGPAAGILGAAAAFPGHPLLVLACDLPAVPAALLAALAGAADTGASPAVDWVVPRWRRGIEPLCALYQPPALAELAAGVDRGIAAPHRLDDSPTLRVRHFEGRPLRRFGLPEEIFLNLNTPGDLARWLELAAAPAATAD